jgi:ATP synthase protein I
MKPNLTQAKAYRLLMCQLVFVVTATVACFALTHDTLKTRSVLLGGFCQWLPSYYFTYRVFMNNAKDAKMILRSFYIGEGNKIMLAAILLIGAFKFGHVNGAYLLVAFIMTQQLFWLAPLFFRNKRSIRV